MSEPQSPPGAAPASGAPARIAPELQGLLAVLARRAPELRIPLLVTLAPGAAAAAVLPVAPTLEVALTRLAAAELTAGQALALLHEPRVERVELDGEAEALLRRAGLPR